MSNQQSGVPVGVQSGTGSMTRLLTSVFDQVFASASVFLIGSVTARAMSVEAFTAFSACFLLVVLWIGLAQALILLPLSVSAGTDQGSLLGREDSCGLLLLMLPVAFISFAGLLFFGLSFETAFLAGAFAASRLILDYRRRILALDGRSLVAIAIQVIAYTPALILVAVWIIQGRRDLSPGLLLAVLAVGSLASLPYHFRSVWRASMPSRAALARLLSFCAWSLGTMLSSWAGLATLPIVVGTLLVPADLAALFAGRSLLGLANVLFQALDLALLHKVGRLPDHHWILGRFRWVLMAIYGIPLVLIWPFCAQLVGTIYGEEYVDRSNFILLIMFSALPIVLHYPDRLWMNSRMMPQGGFLANLAAFLVLIPIAVLLVGRMGSDGAVIALASSNAVLLLTGVIFRRYQNASARGAIA